jgi:hypothetical protein
VRVVGQVEEDIDIDIQSLEADSVILEAYTLDNEKDRAVANIRIQQRHSDIGVAEAEEANKRRHTEELEGIEKARRTYK